LTYQLGSTSIAGHEALNGSSLRPPKLDGAPRGCINGSMNKQNFDLSQENLLTKEKNIFSGKCLMREIGQ